MSLYKIAETVIELDIKHQYARDYCADYLLESSQYEEPAFRIAVSDEEINKELVLYPNADIGYLESVCLLRKVALEIVNYGKLLVHSAVVAVDGKAYAFLAESGGGKTTHIVGWKKRYGSCVKIINGDKPFWSFDGGKVYVHGTPWGGKEGYSANRTAPLMSACFIKQSKVNRIRKLDVTEAIERIMPQVYLPYDRSRMALALDLVSCILQSIRFYELECDISDEAAELSFKTMVNGD